MEAIAIPRPSYRPATSAGRVLLVDDDPVVLRSLARLLRSEGYEVIAASSGVDALRIFAEGGCDAVVSDISMPEMNGIEITRRIHDIDENAPIILVTGEPTIETAVQAMERGAMRYLLKPVAAEDLREAVKKAVRKTEANALQKTAVDALNAAKAELEGDLRTRFNSALDQLYMVYQPIIRWADQSIAGYEALVRSTEPSIPHPGALFDAANRLQATLELGRAIRMKAPLPMMEDDTRGKLFFNLHVRDLTDTSLYDPDSPLVQMADRVVLEITERAAIEEVADADRCVRRLREMGFHIAVDDLGAGYAALNSFAALEPDVVKLDMSLIRDVHLSPVKQKVVRSMTALCHDMGIEVVAEGVENTDERDTLVELGCDLFQGYYFAKPARPFIDPKY